MEYTDEASRPRVRVHTPDQEDEQLRRLWRRAGGEEEPSEIEGHLRRGEEPTPEASWGPV